MALYFWLFVTYMYYLLKHLVSGVECQCNDENKKTRAQSEALLSKNGQLSQNRLVCFIIVAILIMLLICALCIFCKRCPVRWIYLKRREARRTQGVQA